MIKYNICWKQFVSLVLVVWLASGGCYGYSLFSTSSRRQRSRRRQPVQHPLLQPRGCSDDFIFDQDVFHHRRNRPLMTVLASSSSSLPNGEEPDLFDYFDPLLSPHAYPNGISPDEKPVTNPEHDFPPTFSSGLSQNTNNNNNQDNKNNIGNDNDYYDPLRIESRVGWLNSNTDAADRIKDTLASGSDSLANAVDNVPDDIDIDAVFDPTLSPHLYTSGKTPDLVRGDAGVDTTTTNPPSTSTQKKKKNIVGILLMDHGSRNVQSNERLHEIARTYEQVLIRNEQQQARSSQFSFTSGVSSLSSSSNSNTVVVRAAHMEIATPTVQDGIRTLVDLGVDEIVCHPFFLSPSGRHVSEDIPQLVHDAIQQLNVKIPVRTTAPTGANINVMIDIIHSMVQETSSLL